MVPVSYATSSLHTRRSASHRVARLGFLSARMIGFILLALLALLYIAQTSRGASTRITEQSLKAQADQLTYEQKQLLLDANRLRSLDTLRQSAPATELEPVTTIEYLAE